MRTLLQSTLMAVSLTAFAMSTQAGVNELYNQSCATCHAAGVLGAPKTGDKAAWAPRIKQGMPTLVSHVKNGYKNMPARGLCDSCTDADYAALIELMSK